MNKGLIPTRYAKALLEYAQKNNVQDIVYQEVLQIAEVCQAEKRVNSVLMNPVLSKQEKTQIIGAIAGKNVSAVFNRFIEVIVENERESFLQRICLRYIDIYREKHNIHFGRLTTAVKIDPQTENRIFDMIKSIIGGTVETVSTISTELLGGFIVDVDSNRWDASLAGQLRRIKMDLS
ncbi:MAG: F0F1 ATP synthase subunit delta [Paludibacter sp.]|nr:F0F1 ATP synthase subunit delta [Paludibacter sp.]